MTSSRIGRPSRSSSSASRSSCSQSSGVNSAPSPLSESRSHLFSEREKPLLVALLEKLQRVEQHGIGIKVLSGLDQNPDSRLDAGSKCYADPLLLTASSVTNWRRRNQRLRVSELREAPYGIQTLGYRVWALHRQVHRCRMRLSPPSSRSSPNTATTTWKASALGRVANDGSILTPLSGVELRARAFVADIVRRTDECRSSYIVSMPVHLPERLGAVFDLR